MKLKELLEKRAAEIKEKINASQSVEEVRELGETLRAITEELRSLEEAMVEDPTVVPAGAVLRNSAVINANGQSDDDVEYRTAFMNFVTDFMVYKDSEIEKLKIKLSLYEKFFECENECEKYLNKYEELKEKYTDLNKKLAEKFTGPVFVLSHLPLHYSYRSRSIGDTQYASYIFDVLNEAAGKGLNIFFLFGHDHSSGWDDYLGASSICLEKGDTINICKTGNRFKWTENTLNFTYMNAGYTGYYDNHNGGDDALTMTVFRITDTDVTVTRYDKNGRHNVASAGVSNSYKREKGYAPNTDVKGSPLTISLTPVTDITPVPGELDRFSQIIMFFFTIISNLLTAVC